MTSFMNGPFKDVMDKIKKKFLLVKARKYKVNATKINFLASSGENMRFFAVYLTNIRHGTFVYVGHYFIYSR